MFLNIMNCLLHELRLHYNMGGSLTDMIERFVTDLSHSNCRKSVLVYPVILADLQDTILRQYLESCQQFKVNFCDRLSEHCTKGFVGNLVLGYFVSVTARYDDTM